MGIEVRYQITKQWCISSEMEAHWGYGIAVRGLGAGRPLLLHLKDISCDRCFVEQLVRSCNRLRLDPCQFLDVVQDQLQ